MTGIKRQMERQWDSGPLRFPLHRARWLEDWNGKLSHAQGTLITLPCDWEPDMRSWWERDEALDV